MHKLLIASIVCLILSFACFAYGVTLYFKGQQIAKHTRHQPYVELDTEEEIKTGDTLYVVTVRNDSIFLYGK